MAWGNKKRIVFRKGEFLERIGVTPGSVFRDHLVVHGVSYGAGN